MTTDPHPVRAVRLTSAARRACAVWWLLGAQVFLAPALHAQVVSQGRGVLTLMVGQGSGPVGNVASEVSQQTQLPQISQHSIGWRVAGGYNFADYFGTEAAVGRIGYIKNSAAYHPSAGVTDQVRAETALNVIEVNLVGRVPLAQRLRADLTLGVAETSLDTSLSTQYGYALPTGQANPVTVRRFGYDAGIDGEWMAGEHLSLIVGYHAYPNVGSASTVGSAHGSFGLFGAGVHIEF